MGAHNARIDDGSEWPPSALLSAALPLLWWLTCARQQRIEVG